MEEKKIILFNYKKNFIQKIKFSYKSKKCILQTCMVFKINQIIFSDCLLLLN